MSTQINEMLTLLVDRERSFFNEEARRLNEFYPLTKDNEVANLIYSKWYLAYTTAMQVYQRFDQTAQTIKAGQIAEAKKLVNLPEQAPLTGTVEGDKRILSLLLINDFLPSENLKKTCKEQNRELIGLMVNLSKEHPQAVEELDLLSTWIATFPHQQEKEQQEPEQPGFFGGWIETALKVFAGYLIGSYDKKRKLKVYEEPPPFVEEEYYPQEEPYF